MSDIHENAVMILRHMLEAGLISPRGISPARLREAVGFNQDEFSQAEHFLLQGHFIDGGGSGDNDIRRLTASGVQYVTEEMRKREPIGLDSERVLKFLIREIKQNEFLTHAEILKGTGIAAERYRAVCQQLADFDFIEVIGDDEHPALIPTKSGRQAVHRNFQASTFSPTIQAGAIFNGPVSSANIQAVANAIDSNIQQNVSSLAPEALHKEINQVLETLLGELGQQLTLQQKAVYVQLAADFQKEIDKSRPDSTKLHKLLAGLGLLSDLGGTIDFSQKTFELIVRAGPYIILLGQLVVQLLQHASH